MKPNPTDSTQTTPVVTPETISNRPGLSALTYRVGTHGTFLETMKAQLSSKLPALTTRDSSDFAIALLDAWATIADILTFYQERIANEGYLNTATERRSILELGRLVGYALKPGVAASTYLAFLLEDGVNETSIPQGTRVKSSPEPGEESQTFETSESIKARSQWNTLKPRQTRPQDLTKGHLSELYIKGINNRLKENDLILLDSLAQTSSDDSLFWIQSIDIKPVEGITIIQLRPLFSDQEKENLDAISSSGNPYLSESRRYNSERLINRNNSIVNNLVTTAPFIPLPSQPISSYQISSYILDNHSDLSYSILSSIYPGLNPAALHQASTNIQVPKESPKVYVFRQIARPFGYNAQPRPVKYHSEINLMEYGEWLVDDPLNQSLVNQSSGIEEGEEDTIGEIPLLSRVLLGRQRRSELTDSETVQATNEELSLPSSDNKASHSLPVTYHQDDVIYLDREYNIVPDRWVVIINPDLEHEIISFKVGKGDSPSQVSHEAITAYGLTGATTKVELEDNKTWKSGNDFNAVRKTQVFVEPELLTLAECPIEDNISGIRIELDEEVNGLVSQQPILIYGEREDIAGLWVAEPALLSGTRHEIDWQLPGDRRHTIVTLFRDLTHVYKRDTVTIYANVARATHGETHQELLGSGDRSQAFQSFSLSYHPLTHLAAPNVSGVESTLKVQVNDILWHEVPNLNRSSPTDHHYITRTDDEGKTTILFGDGHTGARLHSGFENIEAEYRSGLGNAGNVKANQLNQLATRPPGVKQVLNPFRATGGADPESRDQARRNVPLALMALDRLVSVQDYAYFARTFAGIAKARVMPSRDTSHIRLAIAGQDDIPINTTSTLYENLLQAFQRLGNPGQAVNVIRRNLLVLVIVANVQVQPNHRWTSVEPQVRTQLLQTFGFDNRDLGQDVYLSEVIAAIQSVPGVSYVDVDYLGSIGEETIDATLKQLFQTASNDRSSVGASLASLLGEDYQAKRPTNHIAVAPEQLAILTLNVVDTVILQEVLS